MYLSLSYVKTLNVIIFIFIFIFIFIIIHANTTSRQEKFSSGLDIKKFLHNSSVSTCALRKR